MYQTDVLKLNVDHDDDSLLALSSTRRNTASLLQGQTSLGHMQARSSHGGEVGHGRTTYKTGTAKCIPGRTTLFHSWINLIFWPNQLIYC